MSNRRKKAPPVRVDEEQKKRLNWNMLDDRKEDDEIPTCSLLSVSPSPHSSFLSSTEAACDTSVQLPEELPGASSDGATASASLNLTVTPALKMSHIWKALIGEFSIKPAWIPSDCEQRAFVLRRIGTQLCLNYCSCVEEVGLEGKSDEDSCTVECNFNVVPMEDLDWMQKRRVVQLCHQAKEGAVKVGYYRFTAYENVKGAVYNFLADTRFIKTGILLISTSFQVGIYVLEPGLGEPDFLSEGTARLKKANQLIQKLMEYFYDFIIPGECLLLIFKASCNPGS